MCNKKITHECNIFLHTQHTECGRIFIAQKVHLIYTLSAVRGISLFFFNSHQANFKRLICASRHDDERVACFRTLQSQQRRRKDMQFYDCKADSGVALQDDNFSCLQASRCIVLQLNALHCYAFEQWTGAAAKCIEFHFHRESTKLSFGFLIIVECNFKYIIHRDESDDVS